MAFWDTIDKCLAQTSSEKLPLVVDENQYRDNEQTVRDFEPLSTKWVSSSK